MSYDCPSCSTTLVERASDYWCPDCHRKWVAFNHNSTDLDEPWELDHYFLDNLWSGDLPETE